MEEPNTQPEPAPEPAPEPPPASTAWPPPAPEPPPPVATAAPPEPAPDPLAAALKEAAEAIRALVLATEKEIVPELVEGNTPDEVRASVERSRAAYRAALAHIARSLPTPPPPAPTETESADPLILITRGIRRKE